MSDKSELILRFTFPLGLFLPDIARGYIEDGAELTAELEGTQYRVNVICLGIVHYINHPSLSYILLHFFGAKITLEIN